MSVNETALTSDEEELHRLGYAQELRRRMSGFSNFAVSFTIISILSGCLTLYYFGMDEGGPAIIVWGWPIVGIMTLLVGLSMAEVCSSFPTAGGLYYWSAKLARSERTRLVLVHRLVQLPRPGGDHRWHRLRRRVLHQLPAGPLVRLRRHASVAHDPHLRDRAVRARHAEPVRHPPGRPAERRQRLVAHLRRAAHRRHSDVRAEGGRASRVSQVRIHRHGEPLRLQARLLVHPADRAADGPVHLHRVRRLRAHDRRDPQRSTQRPARHRDVDPDLPDRRLGAADRPHVRDPEGELRRRSRARCGCARADLP